MNEGSLHLADSTEAYIALPSIAAYQLGAADFTVEAWVQTYSGGPILGIMASASSPGFSLQVNPGTIEVNTQDGTSYARGIVSGISICDGMWHHVAAVRTGADFVIYLDTVALPIQQSTNGNPPLSINSSDRMTLGAVDSSSISNQHYDGLLSEVRFWNEARTSDQVPVDASVRLQADSIKNTLIGYWPAIFGITLDFSPARNTGAVHGQVMGSGEEPPQAGPNVETLFYVYYGIYALEAETSTNNWSPAGQLGVTSTGFAVLNNSTILDGAKYHAARLKWSSSGNNNPSSASLKFRIDSSNSIYWPTRQLGELCEGSIQPNGSASVNLRGTLMPKRIGCGVALNVGTGLVLANKNGTAVVSPVIATAPGHICRYAGDKVYDMMTQLAVQVHAAGPGHSVQFAAPDPSQDSLQSFDFNSSGNAVLKASPTVALGANEENNVVTVPLDVTDDSQKWLALSESRIFWNDLASSAVLNGHGTSLSVVAKTEENPSQSWSSFRDSFFCEENNLALTINGGPAPGVPLCLAQWSPADENQKFVLRGGLLVHTASDFIVVAQGSIDEGATVVLAEKDSHRGTLGAQWSLSALSPAVHGTDDDDYQQDTVTDGANKSVTYKISITTSSSWFSGTSDQVEVSLSRGDDSLGYLILNNMDHAPPGEPFQTGRTDTFTFQDRDIGQVQFVNFAYGRNNWFYNSKWICNGVELHQSNITNQWGVGAVLHDGYSGVRMNSTEKVSLSWFPFRSDATMHLGMAPAQDALGQRFGWDHTWISVASDGDPPVETFFDCAGGHGGPGANYNVMERRCILNDVVVMSTGQPISPIHPLQTTYGTNRTDGVGNAKLRCDGKINWDGQCHQIANRYLYVTASHTSIDDADSWPNGYMLSCAVFGRYGINFPAWCREIGVKDVPDDAYNNVYFWVQQVFGGTKDRSKQILSYLLTFRNVVISKENAQPDGPDTVHLIKTLHNEGESVAVLEEAFTLTEEQVEKLLGDDSDIRAGTDWAV